VEKLKRQTLLTIAIVIVFLGAWLIGNVLYVLPRATERTDHTQFSRMEEDTGAGAEPLHWNGSDMLWYMYASIMVILVSFTAVVFFYHGSKKGMKTQVLAVVFLIIISISLLVFNLGMRSILPQTVQESFEDTLDFGEGFSIGGGDRVSQFTPDNLGIYILGLLFGSILLILGVARVKDYLSSVDYDEVDNDFEDDISSTVDEAIKNLYKGKDVHSTVIRCYQNMCYILEKQGISNDACITPRELQLKTIEELDIQEETISNLTKLFEKGRYSVHKMDDGDRKKAIINLRQLKKEIQGGGAINE